MGVCATVRPPDLCLSSTTLRCDETVGPSTFMARHINSTATTPVFYCNNSSSLPVGGICHTPVPPRRHNSIWRSLPVTVHVGTGTIRRFATPCTAITIPHDVHSGCPVADLHGYDTRCGSSVAVQHNTVPMDSGGRLLYTTPIPIVLCDCRDGNTRCRVALWCGSLCEYGYTRIDVDTAARVVTVGDSTVQCSTPVCHYGL